MLLLGYIFGIIIQIFGLTILLIPIWEIPLSTREIIDASARYSNVSQRKKDNRRLLNIGISGAILQVIGMIIQIYFILN